MSRSTPGVSSEHILIPSELLRIGLQHVPRRPGSYLIRGHRWIVRTSPRIERGHRVAFDEPGVVRGGWNLMDRLVMTLTRTPLCGFASELGLNHRRVFYFMVHQERERLSWLVQLLLHSTPTSSKWSLVPYVCLSIFKR